MQKSVDSLKGAVASILHTCDDHGLSRKISQLVTQLENKQKFIFHAITTS